MSGRVEVLRAVIDLADAAKLAFEAEKKRIAATWVDGVLVVVAINDKQYRTATRIAQLVETNGFAIPQNPTPEQVEKMREKLREAT